MTEQTLVERVAAPTEAAPERRAGVREESGDGLLADDHALSRIPASEKQGWIPIAFIRLGMISALSQFIVAAQVGYSMTLWSALWTTLIATVVLEVVFILTGIAGAREGLSLSVLARWVGFGRYGSSLVGLAIAISLTGWFGVQNGLFAASLRTAVDEALPLWFCAVLTGLGLTVLVARGFKMLQLTAYVAVPAFVALAAGDVIYLMAKHDALSSLSAAAPGPALTIAQGVTIVVGALIVGAIISPDYARYNRGARDVLLQSLLGIAIGEFGVGFVGFVLARAVGSPDIVTIMTSINGLLGAVIVMLAVVKVNDINLYSSSLGCVNFLHTVFGLRVNRATVALAFGAVGTFLSAIGFLDELIPFLTTLGVVFPPIGGVMIADYFLVRSHRDALERTRASGTLPSYVPPLIVAGLAAWAAGAAVGEWLDWGVPAVNSLVVAAAAYVPLALAFAAVRPGVRPERA